MPRFPKGGLASVRSPCRVSFASSGSPCSLEVREDVAPIVIDGIGSRLLLHELGEGETVAFGLELAAGCDRPSKALRTAVEIEAVGCCCCCSVGRDFGPFSHVG